MTEQTIRCPVCHGAGECEAEKRLYVRGMNRWTEYGCRCCQATGRTTASRLAQYAVNRRNDVNELALYHERRKRQQTAA